MEDRSTLPAHRRCVRQVMAAYRAGHITYLERMAAIAYLAPCYGLRRPR